VVNQIEQRFPAAPILLLDSGNFSDNPTLAGDQKTKGLLRAMEQLGYRVVNVGERDIRMGYRSFAARAEGSGLTFISCNIIDRKTKTPIFQPHAVVEAVAPEGEASVRVGVIGAVRYNPVFLKPGPGGGNIVIDPPVARVKKEMETLRKKKVEVVVLLAALHRNDARSIAREVPGIDFILGSYGGLVTTASEREGDTTILYCGNRGQRIGESRVFLGQDRKGGITERTNKLHVLSRRYPADPEMLELVETLRPGRPGTGGSAPPSFAAEPSPSPSPRPARAGK
jgi:2',3'-cyclic-nucleotide 2'-phosphodiesterase (5'-nucleotidase family)